MTIGRQRFLTKEQETLAVKEKTNQTDYIKISNLTKRVKI